MLDSKLYRVALLPSAVFLSVIFGGSYGSGQEMVQFVTSAGPAGGYIALLTTALVWGMLLGTSFELARLFRTHEYAGFMQVLLKRGAIVYEVAILLSMILVLAICASGAGTVLGEHFKVPIWIGSLALLFVAVMLNYYGKALVERTMIAAIVALLGFLVILGFTALNTPSLELEQGFTHTNPILSGGQYAIVNGGFIPLLVYCGRGVQSRAESYTAGFCAAVITVIPGLILHTSFLTSYPQVLSESLPAYFVISQLMSPTFLSFYVLILFVMIIQTAVGITQGLTDRFDALSFSLRKKPLNKIAHAGLTAGVISASMALASIGFVALIAQGYNILVYVFIVTFVIPLLTYGLYLILRGKP